MLAKAYTMNKKLLIVVLALLALAGAAAVCQGSGRNALTKLKYDFM